MKTVLRLVALLSFVILALNDAQAQSRVGVTAATSGGPLGKPPAEAERVLHVGVDVQANEIVRTGVGDRAHLLFLDGSSLTVGPQAQFVIDRFVYDPARKSGELAINVAQGVFRYVGGRISKTTPVAVVTPSATITIRGGILLVDVQPSRTVATFVFGAEMTVRAQGRVQTVSRPGWQVVVSNGLAPSAPVRVVPGSLSPEFAKLEAIQTQIGGRSPDDAMRNSGFADTNSGQGPNGMFGPTSIGDTVTNAINQADTQLQKPAASASQMQTQRSR
ncbi:MAG TPA: FecR domain-containing protein [Reyranella sp.]|jgi:hypothetical protein|nr:FecR domain-containing protein [Reyranella sp.]